MSANAKPEGACQVSAFRCTCLAGLELDVVRTATAGTCDVTLTLKDGWGQTGRPVLTFDLATQRLLGVR